MSLLSIFAIIALTALGAYLSGSIPFGFLIGKAHGLDIREHGSGNIGATNVTRVIGKWWGRGCFALDFLKGCLPVLAVKLLIDRGLVTDAAGILPSLAMFFAVAGHIWPVWLGFQGGKGVSTAAGAILALSPLPLLSAIAVWVIVFLIGRYVSLASILAAALLPVFCWLFRRCGIGHLSSTEFILLTLLAALAILKHTSNIKRLLNGTENRFARKKDAQEKL